MGRFHSFVVFAEMRTGSNFLEANLNAIPGVLCHGEAFNPYFIGGENKQELLGVDMAAREANPRSLLQAMRQQTKGLSGFRYFHDHDPRVFDMVVDDEACAKVILTRNQLESYISWKIAMESDQWWLANTKHLKTVRPAFDLDEFRQRIDTLQAFQARLLNRLQVTGQTPFYIDYDDVLDLRVLNGLAAFLDVPGRLEALDFKFKKQNPEPLIDKVANPEEMQAGLARLDWFGLTHTPNFEPRRQAAVPQYVASATAPLLFMPVKCAPDQRLRKWLQAFGDTETGFDRQGLRNWKATHPGLRSFTVLRHPLARAHAAFSDFIAKEWMPELRPYLKRVHKYQLPPKGEGYATADDYRAGLLVFLELVKHILAGRTELKLPLHCATQGAVLQGFAQIQTPDIVLREDRLAEGLVFLTAEVGVTCPPLPPNPEKPKFALADIYGPDLEAAAREAYWRDYTAFGFADWAVGAVAG
ncbi:MAG: nodulation protein NodH [Rhodobacteraceae bacterium]|jgi:LPS sulfotransferase NodH|nr:nodulation protein NodH [Paracoccaceae bacterium]